MKHTFQGFYKSDKEIIEFSDGKLTCSRIFNNNAFSKEFHDAFEEKAYTKNKAWISNFSENIENITLKSVELKRNKGIFYFCLIASIALFSFSYLTNSLFIWNSLIYISIIFLGLFVCFKKQTIFSFTVKSSKNHKEYLFKCITNAEDLGLIKFVEDLQKIKNSEPVINLNVEKQEEIKFLRINEKEIIENKEYNLSENEVFYFYENNKVVVWIKKNGSLDPLSRTTGKWLILDDFLVIENLNNDSYPDLKLVNGKYKVTGKNLIPFN